MGRRIKIGQGHHNVAMPGKGAPVLNQDDTYVVSDDDYAKMQAAGVTGTDPAVLIVDLGTAPDPGAAGVAVEADPVAGASLTAHLNDTDDAHDASAVSVNPSGLVVVTTTNVQAALAQLDAAAAAAGLPSGPAGGALAGTYPSPSLAAGGITNTEIAANAAIAPTKVALVNDGGFTNPTQRSASMLVHRRRRSGTTVAYGPLGCRAPGSLAISGGLCYFMPIHVERPLTIGPNVALNVITAATAGNVRMALYADDGQGHPTGAPLASSAATLITTTGIKSIGFSYQIATPDIYHLAMLVQNDVTGAPAVGCYAPMYDLPPAYQSGLTTAVPNPVGALVESGSATWPVVTYNVSAYT